MDFSDITPECLFKYMQVANDEKKSIQEAVAKVVVVSIAKDGHYFQPLCRLVPIVTSIPAPSHPNDYTVSTKVNEKANWILNLRITSTIVARLDSRTSHN